MMLTFLNFVFGAIAVSFAVAMIATVAFIIYLFISAIRGDD